MHAEQRLVDTLIKHWRRRKGTLSLPLYEQFIPEALGDDVWQYCCSFQVQKVAQKWVYMNDFIGDNVREAIGKDLAGEVITSGRSDLQAARMLEKAEEVMRLADPLMDEGHFINENTKIIKFRSCLLPFGRDRNITHLVLGLSWQAF